MGKISAASLNEDDTHVPLSSSSSTTTTTAPVSAVNRESNFRDPNNLFRTQNVYKNSIATMLKHDSNNNSSINENSSIKKFVDHLLSSVPCDIIGKQGDFLSTKVEPDRISVADDVDCYKSIPEKTKSACMFQNTSSSKTNIPSLVKTKVEDIPSSVKIEIKDIHSLVKTEVKDIPSSVKTEVKDKYPNAITSTTVNTTSLFSYLTPNSPFNAASSPLVCATKTTDVLSYGSDVTTSVTNTFPQYSFFKFSEASRTPASALTSTNLSSLGTVNSTSVVVTSSDCLSSSSHLFCSTSLRKRPFSDASRTPFLTASSANLPFETVNSTSTSLIRVPISSSRCFSSKNAISTSFATTSFSAALSTAVSSGTGTNKFSFRNATSTAVIRTAPFVATSSVSTSSNTSENVSPLNRNTRRSVSYSHHPCQVILQDSKNSVETPMECRGPVDLNIECSTCSPMECTGPVDLNTKCSTCSSDTFNSLHSRECLSQDLGNLLDKKLGTDVQFNCNGQTFSAHKSILMARSEFFANMFHKETPQSPAEEIPFNELMPDVLGIFLKYLYTGKLPVDLLEDAVCELYAAAHKYQVCSLSKVCSNWMIRRLTEANYLKMLKLANTHHDDELIEAVACCVTKELLASNEWMKFADEQPHSAIKIYQTYIKNSTSTTECHSPLRKFPRKE